MLFCKNLVFGTILVLFFLNSFQTHAQQNNPLVNSGEVLAAGTKLHDQQLYKEAIAQYLTINRSDTNYASALHELSYSYYADSQFNKAIDYARLGMELFPVRYTSYSMLAANALDEMNRQEEALQLYDSAIKRNPYGFLLYFNKGVVQYKMKNYAASKINMQQSLLINPFYSPSHYFMGCIYMFEGNFVPSILAFQTYLLITPAGKYQSNAIAILNDISKVTDEMTELLKKKKKSKEDDFSMQQEILVSKLALDTKYKLKADLEDNIVRQMQVVNEKLEYVKNDPGFCMQFYVPFYVQTMKDEDFEPLVFSVFSEIKNKSIENWNKKNEKVKNKYIEKASAYFVDIKRTQVLNFAEREKSPIVFAYEEGSLIGTGKYTAGENPVNTGLWNYFYEKGSIKAQGNFDDTGEKTGVWVYYHENGTIKEKASYNNKVLNGLVDGWFDNGNLWYSQQYLNGKLNGIQKLYFYNGNIRTINQMKDDVKNGEEKFYSLSGELNSIDTYTEDKLNGWSRSYHPDGKVKAEVQFVNDKEEGNYKSYHTNGKVYTQGELKEGLRQGLWITFFEDGTIAEKTAYIDGEITGEFIENHENGNLKQKGSYYKKKIDGKVSYFDDDAIKYCDAQYEKGKLREIIFYDKKGTVISTTTTRKGAATIIFYNADGIKASEGYFNKDGEKDGKFVTYFYNGKLSEASNWKDGVMNGAVTYFYPDGNIKKKTNYTDGAEDGYVIDYYANGKISAEGWRVAGKREQTYIYYNALGDISTTEYFLNDELDGYTCYYDPGNSINAEYLYASGWRESIRQLDKNGRTLSYVKFYKGSGTMEFKHANGRISSKGEYHNYNLHGALTYYYFDGSIHTISHYKHDNRDSVYKSYYYGGKTSAEGTFKNGAKTGTWQYHFPNGELMEVEKYNDEKDEVENKTYFPDGDIEKIIHYKTGELSGNYDINGAKNQLAVRINYKNGIAVSYQYEAKPGVLCNPVVLNGATGKVEATYANGQQSASFEFIENEMENKVTLFYSDGKKYIVGNRKNGFRHGTFVHYYPSGLTWKDENYSLGNLHGICKYYFANGKLEREENYYNDEKHGTCKIYDETGKLKQTLEYHYGTLTGIK